MCVNCVSHFFVLAGRDEMCSPPGTVCDDELQFFFSKSRMLGSSFLSDGVASPCLQPPPYVSRSSRRASHRTGQLTGGTDTTNTQLHTSSANRALTSPSTGVHSGAHESGSLVALHALRGKDLKSIYLKKCEAARIAHSKRILRRLAELDELQGRGVFDLSGIPASRPSFPLAVECIALAHVTKVSASRTDASAKDIELVCHYVSMNPSVLSLDLSHNPNIGREGAMTIAVLLRLKTNLVTVDVSECGLDATTEEKLRHLCLTNAHLVNQRAQNAIGHVHSAESSLAARPPTAATLELSQLDSLRSSQTPAGGAASSTSRHTNPHDAQLDHVADDASRRAVLQSALVVDSIILRPVHAVLRWLTWEQPTMTMSVLLVVLSLILASWGTSACTITLLLLFGKRPRQLPTGSAADSNDELLLSRDAMRRAHQLTNTNVGPESVGSNGRLLRAVSAWFYEWVNPCGTALTDPTNRCVQSTQQERRVLSQLREHIWNMRRRLHSESVDEKADVLGNLSGVLDVASVQGIVSGVTAQCAKVVFGPSDLCGASFWTRCVIRVRHVFRSLACVGAMWVSFRFLLPVWCVQCALVAAVFTADWWLRAVVAACLPPTTSAQLHVGAVMSALPAASREEDALQPNHTALVRHDTSRSAFESEEDATLRRIQRSVQPQPLDRVYSTLSRSRHHQAAGDEESLDAGSSAAPTPGGGRPTAHHQQQLSPFQKYRLQLLSNVSSNREVLTEAQWISCTVDTVKLVAASRRSDAFFSASSSAAQLSPRVGGSSLLEVDMDSLRLRLTLQDTRFRCTVPWRVGTQHLGMHLPPRPCFSLPPLGLMTVHGHAFAATRGADDGEEPRDEVPENEFASGASEATVEEGWSECRVAVKLFGRRSPSQNLSVDCIQVDVTIRRVAVDACAPQAAGRAMSIEKSPSADGPRRGNSCDDVNTVVSCPSTRSTSALPDGEYPLLYRGSGSATRGPRWLLRHE